MSTNYVGVWSGRSESQEQLKTVKAQVMLLMAAETSLGMKSTFLEDNYKEEENDSLGKCRTTGITHGRDREQVVEMMDDAKFDRNVMIINVCFV